MKQPINEGRERLLALDSLRGLAAFSVMLAHFGAIFPVVLNLCLFSRTSTSSHSNFLHLLTYTPLHIFWVGGESVIFFFVLSGFVLAIPFLDAAKSVSYATYLTKRICRIYPPYFIAVCIAILANLYFYRGGIPELSGWFNKFWQGQIDWRLVVSHFFLIGSFDNSRFDPVIWSLVIEMRISIMFPLLIWLVRKFDWKISLMVAIGSGFIYWVITRLKFHGYLNYDSDYFDTLRFIGCFIIGGVLAKHRLTLVNFFKGFRRPSKGFFFVFSILAYTNIWWLYRSDMFEHTRLSYFISNFFLQDCAICLGVAGFIIIGLSSRSVGGVLASRPLLFLGKISYSLYLYHVICLFSLLNIFYGRIPTVVILAMALVFSLTMAAAGYYLVEVPAMNIGRQLTSAYKNMKTQRTIEYAIYALLVILSLVALWLVLNAPPDMLNSHSVYQGF